MELPNAQASRKRTPPTAIAIGKDDGSTRTKLVWFLPGYDHTLREVHYGEFAMKGLPTVTRSVYEYALGSDDQSQLLFGEQLLTSVRKGEIPRADVISQLKATAYIDNEQSKKSKELVAEQLLRAGKTLGDLYQDISAEQIAMVRAEVKEEFPGADEFIDNLPVDAYVCTPDNVHATANQTHKDAATRAGARDVRMIPETTSRLTAVFANPRFQGVCTEIKLKAGDIVLLLELGGLLGGLSFARMTDKHFHFEIIKADENFVCGSDIINKRFGEYLKEKRPNNRPSMLEFAVSQLGVGAEEEDDVCARLMNRFEGIKKTYPQKADYDFKIRHKGKVAEIPLTKERMDTFFKPLWNDIYMIVMKNWRSLMNEISHPGELKLVLSAGGFAENAYIQKGVENIFRGLEPVIEVIHTDELQPTANAYGALLRGSNLRYRESFQYLTFGIVNPKTQECFWLTINGIQQQPYFWIHEFVAMAESDGTIYLRLVVCHTSNVEQGEPLCKPGTTVEKEHFLLLGPLIQRIDVSVLTMRVEDFSQSYAVGVRIGLNYTDDGISLHYQMANAVTTGRVFETIEGTTREAYVFTLHKEGELIEELAKSSAYVVEVPSGVIEEIRSYLAMMEVRKMFDDMGIDTNVDKMETGGY